MHALALRLGRTVDELLRSISSTELTDWMAYYRMEPFDDQRADLRSAIIASTTANAAPRRKGARVYRVDEFMPYRAPMSAATIRAGLQHLVVRKKDKDDGRR